MSLIKKLKLIDKTREERIEIINAEKAKIKQIRDALGCDELDYCGMTAHEIATEVLAGANHEPKPGSLHELFGGNAYFWRTFGSKEKLVEFLTPFLADDTSPAGENPLDGPR